MNPVRSADPRRGDDAVLRGLATEVLNQWLGNVSRKFVIWFVLTVTGSAIGVSWVASAWAANRDRDVADVTKRVDRIEVQQEAQLQAMRDLTRALDSLRITLQR